MYANKLLPLLALIAGAALGAFLFFCLSSAMPAHLTDANSGAFSQAQLVRRVFFGICFCAGLGGAAIAWVGWRLSNWEGSSRVLATLMLVTGTSATATILGRTYMPDAASQILWILPLTGFCAALGASLAWWYWDSSAVDAL